MSTSSGFPVKVLPAGPDKAIYAFSGDNVPVMTALPGETVIFETLDCFGGEIRTAEDRFESVGWDKINPATGPLFIEGAEPGDTLAVEILDIEVGDQGVMTAVPGMGAAGERIRESITMIVPVINGLVHFGDLIFEARPMIGVIGTAPAIDRVPTGTPGPHGGNMDSEVIAKGSTVYLPVAVHGALLAMGDLHALMGDGEVLICGVEVPGRVTVSTRLLKKRAWPCPLIETDSAYYVVHSAETLDEAAAGAVKHALDLMVACTERSPEESLALLSIQGNLQISQVVDPLKTVRMEVPKAILRVI
jgi:amidase